jgi:AraC-like DNA-binding protein
MESAAFPEIAYAFNRTFKRVFGQSPSDFRARLSSSKRTGKAA